MKRACWWLTVWVVSLLSLPVPGSLSAQGAPDTLRLAEAVRLGLSSDPRIAGASARLGQAAAARGTASAGRLPSVSASALLSRYRDPMIVWPLHGIDPADPPVFDPTLVQGRVLVSQLLYDGGVAAARLRSARGVEDAARASEEDVRSAVLEELVETYLAVLSARDVVVAERQRTLDLEAEMDRASRMFDEGASPRLTVLRAASELSATRADVAAAEARAQLAEAALARRMGVSREVIASTPIQDLVALQEPAGPSTAPTEAPAVVAAKARTASAAERVREAAAARHPRLSATGGIQEFGSAGTSFSTEWHGGVVVEYSIFNGGATSHALERARAELRESEANASEVERLLGEARDAAEAARREALARAAALQDAVASLEELVRVERLALDEGAGVQRDYLEAAASLSEARAGLAQARRAAVLAEVRLARAAGHLTPAWLAARTEGVR